MLFVTLLVSCATDNPNSANQITSIDAQAFAKVIKYSAGDPFIETIKQSEFFKISGLEDKVIETNNGTIISIPKGAFRDSKGNIVEKEITIEITDIDSFEEQFNANINSPSGQNILLNGGALFINATESGNQLSLNDKAPIYIETTQKSMPDLLIFEGIRNDEGEMQWINPKQAKKYLIPVDLDELDFLPEGFANEVEKNMPFGNVKSTTKELIDSLYYSLTAAPLSENSVQQELAKVNRHSSNHDAHGHDYSGHSDGHHATAKPCAAIKPASIKVLKGKKFSTSFIATKQFEERLQTIHKTRAQKALEVYTSNLSQDLSFCDSLVSKLFPVGSSHELAFNAYSKDNWTNLENLPRSVKRLGKYYTTKLSAVEAELKAAKIKYEKALDKKSAKAEKIRENYKKLLSKRENYRLARHGFTLGKLGWTATGKIKKEPFTIDLKVAKGKNYDRVHVYTIDPNIQSIFAWRSIDKVDFNYRFLEDSWLKYKKGSQAKALVVAYNGNNAFYDIQDFIAKNHVDINFTPRPTTRKKLGSLLSQLDSGSRNFNKIKVDLQYQTAFYKEKKRLKKLLDERIVINKLSQFVYQCPIIPLQSN